MHVPLSTLEPGSSRPAYTIPPAAVTRVLETDEPDAALFEAAESMNPVVRDGKTENEIESGDNLEGAAASRSQTTVEDIKHIEERHTPDEPPQSFEQFGVDDREIDLPLSRRIHILGFTAHARFLAHAIASTPDIPISIFAHRAVRSRWGVENRTLSLYDGKGKYISSAAIPCPERILPYRKNATDSDYFLDNVIVDTARASVLPSLKALRNRIDRQTTIFLLHPGLGLVEKINERVFPDPVARPNFILGHSTHKVSKFVNILSMKQKKPGVLYLHGVPSLEGSTLDNSSVAYERMRQSQHLAQLLSSTETLNVVGLPWVRFLSWKLPWLIFCSAADTISVILGCKYNEIHYNPYARALWENLLNETLGIVSQLPELQEVPHRIHYFTGNAFRRKLQTFLVAQGTNTSPWIKHVRMGDFPPVDYFNGYIIQRAEELGLNHKHNSTASDMVKARVKARRWELRNDILSTTRYMTDTDVVGGGQPTPSLDDVLELELEDF